MPKPRPPLSRALFDIVPKVISERKVLPWTLDSIASAFNNPKREENVNLRAEHRSVDEASGFPVTLTLHFAISGAPKYPDSWNISLLLYNVRIDGFGYERTFRDIHGSKCCGWHRHAWNPETLSGEGKIPAGDWPADPDKMTVTEFLARAFREMNVCYEDNYDNDLL